MTLELRQYVWHKLAFSLFLSEVLFQLFKNHSGISEGVFLPRAASVSKEEKRFRKGGRAALQFVTIKEEKNENEKCHALRGSNQVCERRISARPLPCDCNKRERKSGTKWSKLMKRALLLEDEQKWKRSFWAKISYNVKNTILFKYREFQTFLAFVFHRSGCVKP